MENNEIDFSYKECIKSKSNLTSTTYVNICTGETNTVKYGAIDIIGIIVIGVLLISVIGLIITFIVETIRGY